MAKYYSIVKVVGQHESGEGDCKWGYAVWSPDDGAFTPNRIFSTIEKAEEAAPGRVLDVPLENEEYFIRCRIDEAVKQALENENSVHRRSRVSS